MSYGYEVPKKHRDNLRGAIVCCLIVVSGGHFVAEANAAAQSKRASYGVCGKDGCTVWGFSGFSGYGGFGGFIGGGYGGSGGTSQVDPGPQPLPDTPVQDRSSSQTGPCSDNPVVLATGNKVQAEMDFGSSSTNELGLMRTYNHYWDGNGVFGQKWITNFDYKLTYSDYDAGACEIVFGIPNCDPARANTLTAYRPDGRRLTYRRTSGSTFTFDGTGSTTKMQMDAAGAVVFYAENGSVETYGAPAFGAALITSRQNQSGDSWLYESLAGMFLSKVTHSSGRYVEFVRDANWKLTGVRDPAGNVHQYTYQTMADSSLLLKSHSLAAAGISETYHYENTTYKTALTGKSINGIRYSTYTYDSTGRVSSTEHAGGVDRHEFTYGAAYDEDGVEERQTIVKNPYGKQEIFRFLGGKLTRVQGLASTYCPASARSITYDANGFKDIEITARGITTDYDHDAKGRLIKLTEAKGTPQERVTKYVWEVDRDRLISEELVGFRKVTYTYRTDGRLSRQRVQNLSSKGVYGQIHDTDISYSLHANQMIQTMVTDGPIAGTGDTFTSNFNAYGDLVSTTNSLGHSTTMSGHNGFGLPARVVGPNGDIRDFTYDSRGRVTRIRAYPDGVTAMDETFTYEANDLKTHARTGRPTRSFSYDAARRLMSISESEVGGTIARMRYLRNSASDPTSEVTERVAGANITVFGRVYTDYDELGRVRAIRGNNGRNDRYTYDLAGNLKVIKDSLGRDTVYEYDSLNRLTSSTDPANQVTRYEYNVDDAVIKVTDPRGLVTNYSSDGFGQLWSQVSPDTGLTTFSYNTSGQQTSMTRQDGSSVVFGFDSLGRISSVSSGALSRTYIYDNCTNGKGRLCHATAPNSIVQNQYEQDGRLRSRRELTTAFGVQSNYLTSYQYDAVGRVNAISYPNSLVVGYGYSNGNLASMTVNSGGVVSNAITGTTYRPFGQISGWSYGNGVSRKYYFDQNYVVGDQRLTGVTAMNGGATLQSLLLTYDATNKIVGLTNYIDTARSKTFEYDLSSRLTMDTHASGFWRGYNYDANGNRSSTGQSGSPGVMIPPTWYNIDSGSNILTATRAKTYTNDSLGNRTGSIGPDTFRYTYDVFNQMSSASRLEGQAYAAVGTYGYNAFNERVSKAAPSLGHYRYTYGPGNVLMSEHRDENDLWTNYLWFGGQLVGLWRGGQMYYVHGDQQDRPEIVTNGARSVVWRAANDAFDRAVTVDTIGGLNLGFPGQYQDEETKLWYNINRYYDAETGRYTQADPIGLAGGLNVYSYVGGNPIGFTDRRGLACDQRGCWNTPEELALVRNDDPAGYYALACSGGDPYACRGHEVATNTGTTPTRAMMSDATNRKLAISILANQPTGCPKPYRMQDLSNKMAAIRLGLVNARVQQLSRATPSSPVQVTRGSISDFHHRVFEQNGADGDAFGGDLWDFFQKVGSHLIYDWCEAPACSD